jgi:hypothetical protein
LGLAWCRRRHHGRDDDRRRRSHGLRCCSRGGRIRQLVRHRLPEAVVQRDRPHGAGAAKPGDVAADQHSPVLHDPHVSASRGRADRRGGRPRWRCGGSKGRCGAADAGDCEADRPPLQKRRPCPQGRICGLCGERCRPADHERERNRVADAGAGGGGAYGIAWCGGLDQHASRTLTEARTRIRTPGRVKVPGGAGWRCEGFNVVVSGRAQRVDAHNAASPATVDRIAPVRQEFRYQTARVPSRAGHGALRCGRSPLSVTRPWAGLLHDIDSKRNRPRGDGFAGPTSRGPAPIVRHGNGACERSLDGSGREQPHRLQPVCELALSASIAVTAGRVRVSRIARMQALPQGDSHGGFSVECVRMTVLAPIGCSRA